jgi:hypothetical protein
MSERIRGLITKKVQDAESEEFPAEVTTPVESLNPERATDESTTTHFPDPTHEGANFLGRFLEATPFLELFQSYANAQYSGNFKEVNVAQLRARHPWFYYMCMTLDTIVRAFVVISLVAIAIIAAYKVLAPLPDL